MWTTSHDEWVEQLPDLISRCRERWRLVVGEQLSGGLVGHVFACTTSDRVPAVLKLTPPAADEFAGTPEQQAAALRAWSGRGAIELLAFASDLRALLTRRALPGTPLQRNEEHPARHAVADVLSQLFEATIPPVDFEPLVKVADRHLVKKLALNSDARAWLEPLIAQARASAQRLVATSTDEVLLHGDVMDKNLLWHHHRVVAIDPMPCVGDPHSDIGFWAASRSPANDLEARATEVAELAKCNAQRAGRWGAIFAVGAACETWRHDISELRHWVRSTRAAELLNS